MLPCHVLYSARRLERRLFRLRNVAGFSATIVLPALLFRKQRAGLLSRPAFVKCPATSDKGAGHYLNPRLAR